MKHMYFEPLGSIPAVADLSVVDDTTWEINRVNVPSSSRGLGHGKRILRQVIQDADEEDATLVLRVMPSGPLDWDALTSWYRRNGFAFCEQPDDYEMIRQPREP